MLDPMLVVWSEVAVLALPELAGEAFLAGFTSEVRVGGVDCCVVGVGGVLWSLESSVCSYSGLFSLSSVPGIGSATCGMRCGPYIEYSGFETEELAKLLCRQR